MSIFMKKQNSFSIYFGVPGSGKSTIAAYLAKRYLRKKKNVYSNVPIKGCYEIDAKEDIGTYMIKDGLLIIDEAGIEYNNRDFKEFTKRQLAFYKKHRHYNIDVVIFSQGYDDMDKKLRTLATSMYLVKRSIIPIWVVIKRIKKFIGIDEMTKDIVDQYEFGIPILDTKWLAAYKLWPMFKTHQREDYPSKEFNIYD